MRLHWNEKQFSQMSAVIMWLVLARGGGELIIAKVKEMEAEVPASQLHGYTVWKPKTRKELHFLCLRGNSHRAVGFMSVCQHV